VESSVRHLSPPNTYSYVQEENLGLTKKMYSRKLLIVFVYYQTKSQLGMLKITLAACGLEEFSPPLS
jgi:hypothetical protein